MGADWKCGYGYDRGLNRHGIVGVGLGLRLRRDTGFGSESGMGLRLDPVLDLALRVE